MTSSLHQPRPYQPHPKAVTPPNAISCLPIFITPSPVLESPNSQAVLARLPSPPLSTVRPQPPTSPLWGRAAPEPYPASHSLLLAGNQASGTPISTSALFILWPLLSSYPAPPSTTPTPFLIPHFLPATPFSLSCPSSLCLYLQACPSLSSLSDLQKIPPLGCIGTSG